MPLSNQQDLITLSVKDFTFQKDEKEKRAAELIIANIELAFQNQEKEHRAAELIIANTELDFQNKEKEQRAEELLIANKELAFQNREKENRAAELVIANAELAFQNKEKEQRAEELLIANKELLFQNDEKEKRAAELVIANKELAFQNREKEDRAAELVIANKELAFQNLEKEKRAVELLLANKELAFQKNESVKEASDYKYALNESSILVITDQNGIIKHVNNNFCKISKYSVDELIGHGHPVINSGVNSSGFLRNICVTIARGNIWRGELKNKAKDDTLYWVDTTIIPFLDDHGKPYQYVAIKADITMRKLAEEKIKTLNNDLEQRVKDRTEDLESFSYSVSHDLRAPVRAVNGYTQILRERYGNQLDAEAQRLMDIITSNSKKMGQLIDDLLAFSRIGRKDMVKVNISIQEMVKSVCNELKIDPSNDTIEFNIKPLLPAFADNTGIRQVWMNLISNAVKYSKLKEKALIEIGSELKDREVTYYVKDNGAGFDMRYVNKLFNIFQRLHSDEEFEGTGIGLAIVQRIISKHDGKVWAEGKVNEGAVFYFTLPKS